MNVFICNISPGSHPKMLLSCSSVKHRCVNQLSISAVDAALRPGLTLSLPWANRVRAHNPSLCPASMQDCNGSELHNSSLPGHNTTPWQEQMSHRHVLAIGPEVDFWSTQPTRLTQTRAIWESLTWDPKSLCHLAVQTVDSGFWFWDVLQG